MRHYSLRIFVALLTFTVGVSSATFWYFRPHFSRTPTKEEAEASAWQILLSFENQDLKKLDQYSKVKLQKAIEALRGKPSDSEPEWLIPRLFSKLSNSQGWMCYVLIEEDPLLSIPGEARIHLHQFSLEGKLFSYSSFPTGNRIALTEMTIMYVPDVGREILAVNSQSSLGGKDIAKQYYALIGGKVLLIRLEDSSGNLIRNYYGAVHQPIGLVVTGRSADEWERALESNDRAEVLAALTWLGGKHWNIQKYVPEYGREDLVEDRISDEVRSNNKVKKVLKRFMESENVWLREAAEQVVNIEYYND